MSDQTEGGPFEHLDPGALTPEDRARRLEEFLGMVKDAPGDARRLEARRAGDALRLLIERIVATEAPVEELARIRRLAEEAAAMIDGRPQGHLFPVVNEASTGGSPFAFFDNSPLLGRANPIAPPMDLGVDGERIVGTVTFGSAYEGAPGCVHGGFIAAAFDELLGMTQSLSGTPGMTGTITVKYRSPTPLHVELRMEGELLRVEGRKIFTEGRLYSGDTLCAESDAVFITVDFQRLADLDAVRRRREASDG